jgi:hypothetical protein
MTSDPQQNHRPEAASPQPPVNPASFNWRSGDGVLLKSTRLAGHGYSTTLAKWAWRALCPSTGSAVTGWPDDALDQGQKPELTGNGAG